jgi:hypothetical protein
VKPLVLKNWQNMTGCFIGLISNTTIIGKASFTGLSEKSYFFNSTLSDLAFRQLHVGWIKR